MGQQMSATDTREAEDMSDFNYQAYSPSRDQVCGHMHHDKKSALNCAEHLGWEDAVLKKIRRQTFRRDTIPEYVGVAYDNTDVYEATYRIRFVARNTDEIAKVTEKLENIIRNSQKAVVQTDLMAVKKVEED